MPTFFLPTFLSLFELARIKHALLFPAQTVIE